VSLFALMFILMSPPSQAFLLHSLSVLMEWMAAWAPISYVLVVILMAAPLTAVFLIRTWPEHVEPESPMAKYRRDPLDEEE
jgi:Na+/phosphate symporter